MPHVEDDDELSLKKSAKDSQKKGKRSWNTRQAEHKVERHRELEYWAQGAAKFGWKVEYMREKNSLEK